MPDQPRALVIDDSGLVRWALRQSLGALGFAVVTAGTRMEALEQLIGSEYGLVVASPAVAREDITDLLRMARRQRAETALILLAPREAIPTSEAWGERTVMIGKPFSVDDVTAAVLRLVPERERERRSSTEPMLHQRR